MLHFRSRCYQFALWFIVTVSLFVAQNASGQTVVVRVDASSTATTPDGTSWTLAYPKLQDGLKEADRLLDELEASDVQVWVANGTYYPDEGADQTDNSRSETFEIIENVKLYAGFHGNPSGETALNQRDPYTNIAILSGEIGTAGMSDNSYHVVYVQTVHANTANLDGFRVRYGNAVGSNLAGGGGGLLVKQDNQTMSGASPWILRCTFEYNQGTQGGAVHIVGAQGSNPLFSNCEFFENESVEDSEHVMGGAALYSNNAEGCEESPPPVNPPGPAVHMYNCLLRDNGHDEGVEAVFVPSGELRTVNCTVVNNAKGLLTVGSTCAGGYVDNCIIWGNGDDSETDQLDGTFEVNHSCIQAYTGSGIGNTDDDPEFVNSTSDFRLTAISPCIDEGDQTKMEVDQNDLNQNNDPYEKIPDLDLRKRVNKTLACEIDMGAYEFLSGACLGDIAGGPNGTTDCVVDVDDLLAVINSWGTCADPCPANIAPGCPSPGTAVDVDDLLAVINNWGDCEGICAENQGVAYYSSMPQSVDDCMDNCSNRFPGGGSQWSDCVDDCVEGLCRAEIIDCD